MQCKDCATIAGRASQCAAVECERCVMLLSDPGPAFAQDLIGHWSRIRGSDLVPLKRPIDPSEMRSTLPLITLADVSRPDAPAIRLAGTGLRQRYGKEITGS